ncbi:MAG TPA: prolipoprotein diacylglyceryl transferase [Chloroflexaceae bacterium]|nr:prolipoprotein diacylglyceryl transferase [Chloroflexaceae bacterium]
MALYPPDDPFLLNFTLFGLPIAVRWYGVIIMSGALLAAYLSARRAADRGYDPDHVWNQLMLGLLMGIAGARIYYVIFEWERFAADLWSIPNLTTGGLAIHGGIIGSLLSVVVYTRWNKLPFWDWVDVCVPGFLLGQAIGRWGNFFNQEAYGRPTSLPVGVIIDPQYRLPPYTNLQEYPLDTLFHATFLYESLWNLAGVGLLLLADRRLGHGAPAGRRWLRPGDLLFLYAVIYSAGRFWIEGLRTDSLCLDGVGGDCAGSLRIAQVMSLGFILLGLVALFLNHRRPLPPPADAGDEPAPDAGEPAPDAAEPAPREGEGAGEARGGAT